jgi:hypothetical protein
MNKTNNANNNPNNTRSVTIDIDLGQKTLLNVLCEYPFAAKPVIEKNDNGEMILNGIVLVRLQDALKSITEHMNLLDYMRNYNEIFIDHVCLSFRHDFGLLTDKERKSLRFVCREWFRAIINSAGQPLIPKKYPKWVQLPKEYFKAKKVKTRLKYFPEFECRSGSKKSCPYLNESCDNCVLGFYKET